MAAQEALTSDQLALAAARGRLALFKAARDSEFADGSTGPTIMDRYDLLVKQQARQTHQTIPANHE